MPLNNDLPPPPRPADPQFQDWLTSFFASHQALQASHQELQGSHRALEASHRTLQDQVCGIAMAFGPAIKVAILETAVGEFVCHHIPEGWENEEDKEYFEYGCARFAGAILSNILYNGRMRIVTWPTIDGFDLIEDGRGRIVVAVLEGMLSFVRQVDAEALMDWKQVHRLRNATCHNGRLLSSLFARGEGPFANNAPAAYARTKQQINQMRVVFHRDAQAHHANGNRSIDFLVDQIASVVEDKGVRYAEPDALRVLKGQLNNII
ncbi:expressed unknown protein [Seminavis robusta]|uniref:Uncharacterized protein n=1 Tax=Seminavis robusta TaxID=568900 RepID=A0A9N8DBP1_9STRA|nr:expressed unknown protein [Seminavis robusta]|eukprot:Sro47_g027760.1 n/a (264) ;mRNA; f:50563-51354